MKFKQPFDMLAEFSNDHEFRKVQESQKMPTFEKWLPNLDEFRTFAADIQETVNRSCYISLQPMAEASFACQ